MLQQTLMYKKANGNQYVYFLRILVPPQILVPLVISVKFGMHCLCSINFQDHLHKSDFDIYHPVTIPNFPQMLA